MKIGILGCGWLGLPLAISLRKRGFDLYGTTTSEHKLAVLASEGIQPYKIVLGEDGAEGLLQTFLSAIEVLIIAIPPGLRKNPSENYVKKMELLLGERKGSGIEKVIFISSISVYGDKAGEFTEASEALPQTESGRQLLAVERLISGQAGLKSILIRFGGLLGPDRHPVTTLSGKRGLRNGDAPVNLIQLQDCLHLIETVFLHGHWNEIFNGVYPAHPSKREYYTKEAIKRGLPAPDFLIEGGKKSGKIVISKNFLDKGYSFFTSI